MAPQTGKEKHIDLQNQQKRNNYQVKREQTEMHYNTKQKKMKWIFFCTFKYCRVPEPPRTI